MKEAVPMDNILEYYNRTEYVKDAEIGAIEMKRARYEYMKKYDIADNIADNFSGAENLNNGKIVAELGCGSGVMNEFWKKYIGFDVSYAAIEKLEGKSVLAEISKQLPIKNNSVDAVISFNVLEHLQKPEVTIEEAVRILKPRGKILFWDAFHAKKDKTVYYWLKVLAWRIFGKAMCLLRIKVPIFRVAIEPDFTKIGHDYDAMSSLDSYNLMLFLESRGFKCINKKPFALIKPNPCLNENFTSSKHGDVFVVAQKIA